MNSDAPEAKKKVERHKRLEAALGPHYYRTNAREIENLLSCETLLDTVRHFEGDDAELDETFKYADYQGLPIAAFIEQRVLKGESKRRHKPGNRPYAAPDGTLKDKPGFARLAVERIHSFGELTEEAKALMTVLYAFIAEANT